MKKKLMIILCLFLTTGCVKLNNASIKDIEKEILSAKTAEANHVNQGFKYYIPRGLTSMYVDERNEIIKSENAEYYLYVDLVSYYNKIEMNYNKKEDIYYSEYIKDNDKSIGSIEVIQDDKDYLVIVKYKYTSIQAKCKKEFINEIVANSLIIERSVKYNDDVIEKLLNSNILNGEEEEIKIFDSTKEDVDTLDYEDTYVEEEYDSDVIN